MAKHKHCKIIKAYADGYPIQVKVNSEWLDIDCPHFYDTEEYRIKPHTVTKVGWVNIHKNRPYLTQMNIWESENEARANRYVDCVATVRISWEEEE